VLDFLEIYCDTSPICEREPAMLARQARTNFPPHAGTILPAAGGDQKAIADARNNDRRQATSAVSAAENT
jgi:hypothetical protein